MINIITGKIQSSKTTKLISLFEKHKNGDGFACKKVYKNEKFIGYNIVHLQTGKAIPFAYLKFDKRVSSLAVMKYIPKDWNEKFQFGQFSFSKEGFIFAEKIIDSTIKNNIEPIFIDEIGPVEILMKKGFYKLMKKVLKSKIECYITIRNDMLDKFVEEFHVNKYNVIIV